MILQRNPNTNTSELTNQATHENSSKKTRIHSSQEKEIEATMIASIQPEVRFSTKSWKNLAYIAKELGSSPDVWVSLYP
jgi:hypothetical protein